MTGQNVYDDEEFFAEYQAMRVAQGGINEALEQPALRALLPKVAGTDVIDLGCGDGTLCRFVAEAGAGSVLGVDPSSRMLALATARTSHPRVRYERSFAEEVRRPPACADLVTSSLAFHYVPDLATLFRHVASWLRPGGVLVASMEHPAITATSGSDPHGEGYADEGLRRTHWYVDGVVKYHRRISTIVSDLLDAGLVLDALVEPVPSFPLLERRPDLAVHRRRPPLLLLRGHRPE
ncbi:MAG: class I SAM-dependent methyltransferase [Jatrophihabitans sp.]|uniref:class I SAM-dependent methyltransferase n=1 Tax=Jatrophihabitans sp. TaxID=1932789 RepID=UPI00391249D8